MNTLARNSLIQAAALAAVWVTVSSFAGQTATPKIETRHPDMAVAQAFDVVGHASAVRHQSGSGKGDLLVRQDCADQAWPYIAKECRTGAPRMASRTITIEKRTGAAGSSLIRVNATPQIAAR
jgi:hypothetical protein